MMKTITWILIAISSAVIACADDLTLPNGKTYQNYSITRTEPDGISIKHAAGITKLFFWELPQEMQARYNYDPEKARAYNAQVRSQQAAAYAQQEAAAKKARARAEYEAAHKEVMDQIRKGAFEMVGAVSQITDGGALIRNAKMPYRYKEEVVTPGYTPMNLNRQFVTKTKYVSVADDYEPVFVINAGRNFTDGAGWKAVVYPAGTYKYTTVMGAGKTVKAFALSPETALDNMLKNE